MAFHVELSQKAAKDLKQFDAVTQSILIGWLKKNLNNCYNPRANGCEMAKHHYNNWKYRIGSYRLLSYIDKDRIVILSIEKERSDLLSALDQLKQN